MQTSVGFPCFQDVHNRSLPDIGFWVVTALVIRGVSFIFKRFSAEVSFHPLGVF